MATTAAPSTRRRGTRAHPYAPRRLEPVPEGQGWKLRVNGWTPDATAHVLAANPHNRRPADGRQYVLVDVTLSNPGPAAASPFSAARLRLAGRANGLYRDGTGCVVPDALDLFRRVTPGRRASGNVCFEVASEDVSSLVLLCEPRVSLTVPQVFFALQ
jgi:hypothetical protein